MSQTAEDSAIVLFVKFFFEIFYSPDGHLAEKEIF
jgi:hypothetical protein